MINDTNIIQNSSDLYLQNNIRISSASSYGFEKVMNNQKTQETPKQEQVKINFRSLGAPAGFFLDTSLLDEIELN